METEHATVYLLKEVFPNSLVGLEVMFGYLPPNLRGRTAFEYTKKMAKEPRINHNAALNPKGSAYKVTHRSSAQGCTMLFQDLKGIQHQLKEAHHDASVKKLQLTNNEIIHFVIKQLRQMGYHTHNIDGLEKTWKENNTLYYDNHSFSDSTATKYSRFKQHCILEICKMYNRGDKGGTNHSATMVSDQVTA